MPQSVYRTLGSGVSAAGLESGANTAAAMRSNPSPFAINVPFGQTPKELLAARVKAGDPAAIAEIQSMLHPELDTTKDNDTNWARTVANAYLGGQFKTEYKKESIVDQLKFPAATIGAAALGGAGLSAAGIGAGAGAAGGGVSGATALGGGSAIGGLGGGIGAAGGLGALGAIPAAPAFPTAAANSALGAIGAGSAAAAGGGALSGLSLGGITGAIGKYGPPVLGALGAIGAGRKANEADKLRERALGYATQDYAQRAPLRDEAMKRALAPIGPRPDESALYADNFNPYRRVVPR